MYLVCSTLNIYVHKENRDVYWYVNNCFCHVVCSRPLCEPSEHATTRIYRPDTELTRYTGNLFSSPEHKVLMVSYCDRPLSVVRRPSCVMRKLFYLNIFSSETTHWIFTKLHRNDPWVVPYQSCSNRFSW